MLTALEAAQAVRLEPHVAATVVRLALAPAPAPAVKLEPAQVPRAWVPRQAQALEPAQAEALASALDSAPVSVAPRAAAQAPP